MTAPTPPITPSLRKLFSRSAARPLAAAQRDGLIGDAHGNGIAAEQALVQQLDVGTFEEAQLDQTAFQLRAGQTGAGAVHREPMDAATKAHASLAECYGWTG